MIINKLNKWTIALAFALGLVSCDTSDKVVIYTNADEEAVQAFRRGLDESGFEGQYVLASFSTSELGGKMLAEGRDMEADIVTHSTFYLEEAQNKQKMFCPLVFERECLQTHLDYYAATSVQEGVVFYNTDELSKRHLPVPRNVKDLALPVYKNHIAVPDIMSSSTAWLMVLEVLRDNEADAESVLKGILDNAGVHIDASGSGPLKKIRTGEVAVAYGLRQQVVADIQLGLPLQFVDNANGNIPLTEGVSIVDKGERTNPITQKMVEALIKNGRKYLLKFYPVPLYKGEVVEGQREALPTENNEPLTIDLLKKHQEMIRKLRD